MPDDVVSVSIMMLVLVRVRHSNTQGVLATDLISTQVGHFRVDAGGEGRVRRYDSLIEGEIGLREWVEMLC